MLNDRAHMHRARTSVKFLALLVYVIDREDVVEENVGGVRGHLVVVLTRRTWSGEEMVRESVRRATALARLPNSPCLPNIRL